MIKIMEARVWFHQKGTAILFEKKIFKAYYFAFGTIFWIKVYNNKIKHFRNLNGCYCIQKISRKGSSDNFFEANIITVSLKTI